MTNPSSGGKYAGGVTTEPSHDDPVLDEELQRIRKIMSEPSDKSEGMKFDGGKAPLMRGVMNYFPNALLEVAKVSAYGAQKYAWDNWKLVDDGLNRYSDALVRHLLAETGESHDEESELMHAAHTAWNALARLELMLRKTS